MKKSSRPALKRLFLCFLLLYLLITLLPPLLYYYIPGPTASAPGQAVPEPTPGPALSPAPPQDPGVSSALPEPAAGPGSSDSFTLYDSATEKSLTVPAREFLMADLACEMDLHAPKEALKAQAVAAYTYYSRQRAAGGEIACDSGKWLVYVPEEVMRERWGEDYEEYRQILSGVVDEVYGQTLTYGGELILASYFAISPGGTESVQNVWAEDADKDHPYLQAVASPGDMFSDGYLSYAGFTLEELEGALGVSGLDPEEPLSGAEYTPSGTVLSVDIGGESFTGQEVRAALGLRSAAFTWEPTEGGLRFAVRGWGHGVGLSQAGAVFMAKAGAGYREILEHYYPGAELKGAGPE